MLLKLLRPFCLKFVPLFLSLPVSQLCLMLCDPMDCSPPGSSVLGILQARTLEWGAISFSNAWKWKVKVKSLSRVWLFATPWTAAYRLLRPWEFPGKSTGVGCHCLLQHTLLDTCISPFVPPGSKEECVSPSLQTHLSTVTLLPLVLQKITVRSLTHHFYQIL